uniref:Zinc finger MYM-type protein 1-like n=1 Tax=Nicotiana tabacum TaxID=4097 RepID=A0A1S4A8Z6_TOBAC|nr:PREDICTED: uncharacterized protein LOC107795002 [Nicotiana tabacum]
MDDLRQSQAEKLQEALDMGEIDTGKCLNQELGLARAADTRWGSHYKSFKNFIYMFDSIIDVLDTIVVDARSLEERAKKEHDIANGVLLVDVARKRLQRLRDEGWDPLIDKLATYIVDIRDVDERFSNLKGLCDLSEKLVKTKKHLNYPFLFRRVKFALLLPVATATVEKAFSTMKLIKSEL